MQDLYIQDNNLQLDMDAQVEPELDTPEVAIVEEKPIVSQLSYLAEVATKLNLRTGAGKDFEIKEILAKGDIVEIRKERGEWGRVYSNDQPRGWVMLQFLRKI